MLFPKTHSRSMTSYCILNKCFFRSKIRFLSEVRGAHQEDIESLFFVKKSAMSRNLVKIFRFSRFQIFLLVKHRVFCFRLGTLSKRVIIEKFPRKIVPGYIPGGYWTSISSKRMVFVLINI